MAMSAAKADVTAKLMDHFPKPDGQGWHARAVRAATDRVNAMGLPVARDEYWKYTNPTPLTNIEPKYAGAATATNVFAQATPATLTITDGVISGDLGALDGCDVTLLSDAMAADIHWVSDVYGVLESEGHTHTDRPFAAVNTAIATEGLLIHVTGNVKTPIRICYASNGGQANIHHVIKVDEGASVTLLEEGVTGARSSTAMEVVVADNATFKHLRIQPDHHDRQAVTHTYAKLGTESAYQSFTLTLDGELTRNEAVIEMTGDDASAHIAGACLGDGDFHHDDTVFITHDAVNGESRQVFKKVLRNGATGVFQGKILVKADAQKTDGYQISQSLLMDDDSQFLAKPELEIYADDVACSHGSTSGAIDEDALFYLRSRGVPHGTAVDLLTLSFMAEAVDEISDDDLKDIILTHLTEALEGRHA
ncbi:MAG: SufB/SufD family protein [Planktomarina sp.]